MGSVYSALTNNLSVELQLAAPRAARLRKRRSVTASRRHALRDMVYLKLGLHELAGYERHDLALANLVQGEAAVLEARRERLREAVNDEL